ncbi:uncharacterized protein PHACADRAFT_210208 [Phanerochaete carnosa HHB-10118-sp]|uniref:Uncharacterized protein n=1 Tax=Phanerochaete carnosa (strain HHB-10118-sp) TaxID=650164 RepID=K5VSF0_PHACS|nr:uncharacterized protein PHACADRAFT_210208 [Phanerochaete carnosa HHB-10118-sp]EKM54408.1 hypothetical protein PHACADRAFT_210208 [Phanerochaete carnosa HHB-10118-sp]
MCPAIATGVVAHGASGGGQRHDVKQGGDMVSYKSLGPLTTKQPPFHHSTNIITYNVVCRQLFRHSVASAYCVWPRRAYGCQRHVGQQASGRAR